MRINYWEKFEEGRFYHIYNRAGGSGKLFFEPQNYSFFLAKWQRLIVPYIDVAAYCLMLNHFHFLGRVKPITNEIKECILQEGTKMSKKYLAGRVDYNTFLESQFKRVYGAYALAINKQENQHGSLFQKRFKRVQVRSVPNFWSTFYYIHHNPIHHGFCSDYWGWQHSSIFSYWYDIQSFVACDDVLAMLDPDPRKALELLKEGHITFAKDYITP